jgi:hypothetical protein
VGSKFVGWFPNHLCKTISRFKFGGSIRDHPTHVRVRNIGGREGGPSKLPNLILTFPAIQYVHVRIVMCHYTLVSIVWGRGGYALALAPTPSRQNTAYLWL